MRRRPSEWAPAGPLPAGSEADPALRPGPGETLDCLCGHWRIFQLRSGHRYSTDDLIIAWSAVSALEREGQVPQRHLDLGCGVGSVGFLVLWHFPGLRLLGVEAQAASAGLARRTARFNGVSDRVEVRLGDFRDALGPGDGPFDLVTGSPPYLRAAEGRRSDLPQRGPCRFEDRGGVDAYLTAASARLAPAGMVVWVHATRYEEDNLAAARQAGLGDVCLRPVVFREGKESLISLYRARRSSEPLLRREPPLVVRRRDGAWSEEYREARREMGFPA